MADHMQKLFIHGPEERCKEGFIIRRELAVEKLIANPALNQRVVEIEIRRHVVTFAGLKLLLDTFENLHFLILDDVRFTPSNDSHLRIPCNGLVQKLDLCQTVLPDYVIQALPAVYSLALRCESYDTLRKDLTRHWTIDRAKFESMVRVIGSDPPSDATAPLPLIKVEFEFPLICSLVRVVHLSLAWRTLPESDLDLIFQRLKHLSYLKLDNTLKCTLIFLPHIKTLDLIRTEPTDSMIMFMNGIEQLMLRPDNALGLVNRDETVRWTISRRKFQDMIRQFRQVNRILIDRVDVDDSVPRSEVIRCLHVGRVYFSRGCDYARYFPYCLFQHAPHFRPRYPE
ncbi:hypothetical protein BG004_006495 [Podila humilis]|nr:hypothetical protein BG004_006495 [Podila humilis]